MRDRQQVPRPLVFFVGVTVVSVAALAWLSWRIIAQDKAVERQRWLDRCEAAADSAVAQLTRVTADLQRQLAIAASGRDPGVSTRGVSVLRFREGALEEVYGARLPYYPFLPASGGLSGDVFLEAEALEFRMKQPLNAAVLYNRLANDKSPERRAGALIRLARAYRKANQPSLALESYSALGKMNGVFSDGEPAELMARLGKAEVYANSNNGTALRREAEAISRSLAEGRWLLRRGSYEFATEQTRAWLAAAQAAPATEVLALADAVENVWQEWRDGLLDRAATPGRKSAWVRDSPVLTLWEQQSGRLVVLAAGAGVTRTVLDRLNGGPNGPVAVWIEDQAGHVLSTGLAPQGAPKAVKAASASGLPWTVYASVRQPDAFSSALSQQARLLLTALSLMIVFTVTATVFVVRSISRELAVARLQTDFVAAVSHEFRSPLTTIMQLSEMLVRGRVSGEEKRQRFYETMLGESRRLHRLVDALLNFGRLESGRYEYQFEILNPQDFAQGVIAEFAASAVHPGLQIEFHPDGPPARVRGDREALTRVLWNVLDNAVKYSPGENTIWVDLKYSNDEVFISVRDKGIGIPPGELEAIFSKFVRGTEAKHRSIQGAGIGLAMARTISEAHGGKIEVESVPGQGSTFRLTLPAVREQ